MKFFLRVLVSLMAPIMVILVIPLFLILKFNLQLLRFDSIVSGLLLIIGILLISGGFYLFLSTNTLFINLGKGTLAPWDPPKKLIKSGAYAYVRNPMIIGVLMILWGEALIFFSGELFLWSAIFIISMHLNIVYIEEPDLKKRYPHEYKEYMNCVPRWIPRLKFLKWIIDKMK